MLIMKKKIPVTNAKESDINFFLIFPFTFNPLNNKEIAINILNKIGGKLI